MLTMKRIYLFLLSIFALVACCCDRLYDTPLDDERFNAGKDDVPPQYYANLYDPVRDEGQFWMPDVMAPTPKLPVTNFGLFGISRADRNDPDVPGGGATNINGDGLQYHLLSQSFAALLDKGLAAGKLVSGGWLDTYDGWSAYRTLMKECQLSPTWLVHTGNPLTNPGFGPIDGGVMDYLGKNYVLTDVRNNPESGVVAVVASHVYSAFIVDAREKAFYDANGFTMVYDASKKTTADSWREFKDKCDNSALVVMPVWTGEMADFAIANNLFAININKKYNTDAGGQNADLFKEVLAWLKPNSPVYGWEVGVNEDVFVNPVSQSGNMMVALQEFNVPWFAKNYKARQSGLLSHVFDPHDIDFSTNDTKRFVSYYLSDGAHAGWMLRGFVENYYSDPKASEVKMGFGITATNISQIAPTQFDVILSSQPENTSLIESFGGGYWYADNYGVSANRKERLADLAGKVASHMRQHKITVLEQIAMDPKSDAAKEAYQAFVDANDQLEGIVAIQYAPSYAEAGGEIMWVTNKNGFDIPVVTVSYSIWNFGSQNRTRDGSPTYIAHKLNADKNPFSAVIVHAWSSFADTGESDDELAENQGTDIRGASAAEMCARRLDSDYETVCMQELIWRIRMKYRPEQTEKYLNTYF